MLWNFDATNNLNEEKAHISYFQQTKYLSVWSTVRSAIMCTS